ncbi:amino acid adenylation domain-containing protein [Streptomyces sp. NPDC006285]|uniref:non-ribosomal peptide synthetase n=1 Tax=Streptomyces sp. NPDC006285 TaxID=3364742 RepID=UPI0036ADB981
MPRFEAGGPIPARARKGRAAGGGVTEARRLLQELGAPRGAATRVPTVPRDRALPLSFAGQRLWFLDKWMPDLPVYNSPLGLRLRGPLDHGHLVTALTRVVGRHEILRTRYLEEHGVPHQVVDPAPDRVALPVTDLTGRPDAERDAHTLAEKESTDTFDLAAGPVLRARLIRLAADDHLLVLCIHHIATDGWSTGILVAELTACYAAAITGTTPDLPELPVQYADFASWERGRASAGATERLLAYWRERLADLPALDIPTDRPRPAEQSFRGATTTLRLPEELRTRLSELARAERATLLSVLLAGFNALLTCYTGAEDVVVGSVFSGRTHPDIERLIGFFANTLVLRTSTAGDPAFRELITRTRDTVLGAHLHQELGFDRLVRELHPERDASRNPLFQVCFTLQNATPDRGEAGGLQVTHEPAEQGTSRFDLAVQATEVPGEGLDLWAEYATDLFDADRIERLLAQYATILEQVCADPAIPLSRIDLLGSGQRALALDHAAGPAAPDARGRLLHELFEERAAADPEAPATLFAGDTVSYGELNAHADRIARRLDARREARGDIVGVLLPRGPELPAALLGVLKAGAAYLPVDPGYPKDRIAWLLEDSGCRTVLTVRSVAELLPPQVTPVLLDAQDTDPDTADTPDSRRLTHSTHPVDPASAAYVIYTSGSTGRPKGVVVEHRQAVDFILGIVGVFGLAKGDRVLQFANPAFDVSVFDFFSALTSGAALVQAPVTVLHDFGTLTKLMQAEAVTVADLPPSILAELDADAFPDLRALFVGLEPYPGDLVNRWNIPGRTFHNAYGPTEATVACIDHLVPGVLDGPPPIGLPLPGYRAYLLDDRGDLAPVGVPGELYVGGTGVARGYLGRPGLTAEKFLPDPFGPPGSRVYRTGDLAVRRQDGVLTFLGRADRQIKLNGLRIEPGEIEVALTRRPGIRQALVTVRNGALVAYLVTDDGTEPDATALRDALTALLPVGMIPTAFIALDAFPLNANGKIDHPKLPDPGRPVAPERIEPRTPTEVRVAEIWAGVLGTTDIGVTDDFFALGGNSLRITQITSRIREALGVSLELRAFFRAPTVAALSELIESEVPAAAGKEAAAEPREEAGGPTSTEPTPTRLPPATEPAPAGLVVPLRPGTPGHTPVFFLHASGGSSMSYAALCRDLPPGVPCYGIEALGLDSGPLPRSVAEMADAYADALQATVPEGPYHLVGWSVGGGLAHATAVKLRERGARVALLALLDTQEPPVLAEAPATSLLRALFAENLALTAGHEAVGPSAEELAGLDETAQSDRVVAALVDAGLVPSGSTDLLRRRMDVFLAILSTGAVWRPQAYDGRIDVLLAEDSPEASAGAWAAWTSGPVVGHRASGDHYGMMRAPHVAELARKLGTLLEGPFA